MTSSTLYNVLIIEDHPLISEAYKQALHHISNNGDFSFNIKVAVDCDTGFKAITNYVKEKQKIDLIFLDIKLPPSKNGKILSGEDLGIKINELLPDKVKIIISTTLNDNYRVHNIFKNVNPDGFLIKNDISSNEIIEAIKTVILAPPYYSKSVIKLLRNEVTSDFVLDKLDRQILYELSLGTKTKELPKIVPLSKAGIERRKRHLKEIFNVESSNDKELLYKAKEKGFI